MKLQSEEKSTTTQDVEMTANQEILAANERQSRPSADALENQSGMSVTLIQEEETPNESGKSNSQNKFFRISFRVSRRTSPHLFRELSRANKEEHSSIVKELAEIGSIKWKDR